MAADTLSRQPSSLSRLRLALTSDQWLRLGSMLAIILAFHVIGWGALILVVEPAHLSIGDKALPQTAAGFSAAGGQHAAVAAQGTEELDRSCAGVGESGTSYATGDAAAALSYLIAGG